MSSSPRFPSTGWLLPCSFGADLQPGSLPLSSHLGLSYLGSLATCQAVYLENRPLETTSFSRFTDVVGLPVLRGHCTKSRRSTGLGCLDAELFKKFQAGYITAPLTPCH